MGGRGRGERALGGRGAIVCDASPLIALTQIGRLDLLRRLVPNLVIPPAVAREIARTVSRPPWIVERQPARPFDPAIAEAALGTGETEAIALAAELGTATVVLDDRQARLLAERLGLEVIGTLGLLLAAKRRGLIEAVRPDVEALLGVRFHLSPTLAERVLAEIGEGR